MPRGWHDFLVSRLLSLVRIHPFPGSQRLKCQNRAARHEYAARPAALLLDIGYLQPPASKVTRRQLHDRSDRPEPSHTLLCSPPRLHPPASSPLGPVLPPLLTDPVHLDNWSTAGRRSVPFSPTYPGHQTISQLRGLGAVVFGSQERLPGSDSTALDNQLNNYHHRHINHLPASASRTNQQLAHFQLDQVDLDPQTGPATMFLHSGASLHGHEYSSTRPSPQQPQRRLPFLRSALRHAPDTDARPRFSSTATSTSTSAAPVLMTRPLSYHEKAPSSPPRATRPRPTSDYIPKRELSVRFRDNLTDDDLPPPEAPPSEDDASVMCSDLSDLSDGSSSTKQRVRRKRAPRKSTQFLLAHPAPRLRTKQRKLIQVRPRLMLQLQELSDKRPIPAFDVLPSSLVAGSLIIPRLAKRCPRLFRSKPEVGFNDLLVVRSEDYDAPVSPSSPGVEDSLDQRDLLAIISPLPHMGDNAAEIVMEDGSTWESSLMPNGSYEFIGVDERGNITTARWVKKPVISYRPTFSSSTSETPPGSPVPMEYKWTFSVISPDTRRHPIMGTLVSNTLDVFDTYNTMSASSGRYPPTRPSMMEAPDYFSHNPSNKEGRLTRAVPDDIKLLMVTTATWVNLRHEGWPATSNAKDSAKSSPRRTPSTSIQSRSQTFPIRAVPLQTIAPPKSPQATAKPVTEFFDGQSQELPGRRRSMSTSVRKLIAPRTSMDGGRPPVLESPYFEPPPKASSRRMSVRELTNRIFRRRGNSVQQEEAIRYKLEFQRCHEMYISCNTLANHIGLGNNFPGALFRNGFPKRDALQLYGPRYIRAPVARGRSREWSYVAELPFLAVPGRRVETADRRKRQSRTPEVSHDGLAVSSLLCIWRRRVRTTELGTKVRPGICRAAWTIFGHYAVTETRRRVDSPSPATPSSEMRRYLVVVCGGSMTSQCQRPHRSAGRPRLRPAPRADGGTVLRRQQLDAGRQRRRTLGPVVGRWLLVKLRNVSTDRWMTVEIQVTCSVSRSRTATLTTTGAKIACSIRTCRREHQRRDRSDAHGCCMAPRSTQRDGQHGVVAWRRGNLAAFCSGGCVGGWVDAASSHELSFIDVRCSPNQSWRDAPRQQWMDPTLAYMYICTAPHALEDQWFTALEALIGVL
ncbi:hypothetical protein G7046_g2564 [Stylonectria norvegica]|nr:hypothetical protein G7046_g2564 [Stylonectria norvegica]